MFRKIFLVFLSLAFIAVPYRTASATPSGVGVLGDSATQPYQCIGRGNTTTFTWTEVLNRARNVNFGGEPCEPYNKAWSGHTIRVNMTSQTNKIITDFNNGHISKVVSMLGRNDVYGSPNPPDVSALMDTYAANIQAMINAGIAPSDILIVDINQEAEDSHPSTVYVNQLNAGLLDIANEKGTAFASFDSFQAELDCREIGNTKTYNVGGQIITSGWGNEYHNLRVADGHLGTVGNGLLANVMIIDFLGLPRMTDAEILAVAGGVENPTNPPPVCGGSTSTPPPPTPTGSTSTPTATRTSTATQTATFTRTATNTSLPGSTATFTPTRTPTFTPTWPPTLPANTLTFTPTRTPTFTPTHTVTPASSTITVGETNVLSANYSNMGNRLIAQQVTLSQSATIQSLSYYVSTASGQLRLGIYNNNGSNPGTLVAETAAFTPVVGWNTQNVITPVLLQPGTYWLAFLPQNNALAGKVVASGTGRHYSYTFGALPGSFSNSPTNAAFRFSFYATLSTGAAPSNTPTSTPTNTSTSTAVPSATFTATRTPTAISTQTSVATNTSTFTPTLTATNTPLVVNTSTFTPSATSSPTPPASLSIEVIQPNGGEVLTVGSIYRITWNSTPNIDTVSLGYKSCDSCLDWIVNNIPNVGYYDWDVYVGNTVNTQFKIYIIGYDTGVGSVSDESDNNFTVFQPTPTPTNTPTFTPTRTATPASSTITIGETNVLSANYSNMGNHVIAQRVTLSQSATIQSLSYYVSTASGQLRLGIYNNNGSNPGTLVAETVAFTPVVGWNTQPVLTPTLLPPGTYWLAFLPQNNSLVGRVVASGTGRYYSYNFSALPASFSNSPTSAVFRFSFYATLSTNP